MIALGNLVVEIVECVFTRLGLLEDHFQCVNLFNHPESPSFQVSVHCQTLADNSKHNTIACLKAV